MESYQEHALDSASAVDLVVALYDGFCGFSTRPLRQWSGVMLPRVARRSSAHWTLSFICRHGCAWMSAAGRRRC